MGMHICLWLVVCIHHEVLLWKNLFITFSLPGVIPPTNTGAHTHTLNLHMASHCWFLETQPQSHVGSQLCAFLSVPLTLSAFLVMAPIAYQVTLGIPWLQILSFDYTQMAPKVSGMWWCVILLRINFKHFFCISSNIYIYIIAHGTFYHFMFHKEKIRWPNSWLDINCRTHPSFRDVEMWTYWHLIQWRVVLWSWCLGMSNFTMRLFKCTTSYQ